MLFATPAIIGIFGAIIALVLVAAALGIRLAHGLAALSRMNAATFSWSTSSGTQKRRMRP